MPYIQVLLKIERELSVLCWSTQTICKRLQKSKILWDSQEAIGTQRYNHPYVSKFQHCVHKGHLIKKFQYSASSKTINGHGKSERSKSITEQQKTKFLDKLRAVLTHESCNILQPVCWYSEKSLEYFTTLVDSMMKRCQVRKSVRG